MNTALKRILSIFMSLLMMAGVFAMFGTQQAHAAKKYKLPSKVVLYDFDTETNKWSKVDVGTYKYDKKGNLTFQKRLWNDIEKRKNTYKNGKLRKIKGPNVVRYFDKKGRVTKEAIYKHVTKFKTNSKGYITSGTGFFKFKNSIKYQKNGMPAIIKCRHYAKSFFGPSTEIVKFRKDGLIKTIRIKPFRDWDATYKFKDYKIIYVKSGKQLIATLKSKYAGADKWENVYKYIYTFGSASTKDKRKYVSMMGESLDKDFIASVMPEHYFFWVNG